MRERVAAVRASMRMPARSFMTGSCLQSPKG
jgi:hypothetical protein